MAKSLSPSICIPIICFLFIASTRSFTSHTALTLSFSSLAGAPRSFLTLQKDLTLELADAAAQEKFNRYVLYGGNVEGPIDEWLKPKRQEKPKKNYLQPPAPTEAPLNPQQPQTSTAASVTMPLSRVAHPSTLMDGVLKAVKVRHLGKFKGGDLLQPVAPPHGTDAYWLWYACYVVLSDYHHTAYFNAWINLAHPPPLYQAVHAKGVQCWSHYTEAAITSLIFDAGIPKKEIVTAIARLWKDPEVGRKIKCLIDAMIHLIDPPVEIINRPGLSQHLVSCIPSTPPLASSSAGVFDLSMPKPTFINHSAPETKTYAQLFDVIWINAVKSEGKSKAFAREFVELLRIKAIMDMPPVERDDNPLILYSLPFLKRLRPRILLEYLHKHLEMRDDKKTKISFNDWLAETRQHVEPPKEKRESVQKYFRRDIKQIINIVLKTVNKQPQGESWVVTPFEGADAVVEDFFQPIPGKIRCAHGVLTMVMFSHCLLYLRRTRASGTISQIAADVVSNSGALEPFSARKRGTSQWSKEAEDVLAQVETIVVATYNAMIRYARHEKDPKNYEDIDIDSARRRVGGKGQMYGAKPPVTSWNTDTKEEGASSPSGSGEATPAKKSKSA